MASDDKRHRKGLLLGGSRQARLQHRVRGSADSPGNRQTTADFLFVSIVDFINLTAVAPRMVAGDLGELEVLRNAPRNFTTGIDALGHTFMSLVTRLPPRPSIPATGSAGASVDCDRSVALGRRRTPSRAAARLASVLDALGLKRAVFVGSSFDDVLVANLAVHANARVRALVLLAMIGGTLPDELLVQQMELGVAGVRYAHAGIFPDALTDAETGQIRSRTLVLVGTEERIDDARKEVSRSQAFLPRVSAELWPGLEHLLGLQAAPVVNHRIVRFLWEQG